MITLSAQSQNQSLNYPTINTSPEVYERLDRAVMAYATVNDPLNKLLGVETFDEMLQLVSAVDWLVDCELLDMVFINTNRYARNHFNNKLNAEPRSAWLYNINALATDLLKRNYDQGWEEENRHPVFSLRFPSIHDVSEGATPCYRPSPLNRDRFWPLFVQAVMVKDWFETNCTMRHDAGPEVIQRAAAFVAGAADVLASSYCTLGQYREGSYYLVSSKPSRAGSSWHRNIEYAAKALDAQRCGAQVG